MRKYNCSKYSSCLTEAAYTNKTNINCKCCLQFNICEPHAEVAECYELALSCCRLLVEIFRLKEPLVVYRGFTIRRYGERFFAVKRKMGDKRIVISLRSPDDVRPRVDAYLSKV